MSAITQFFPQPGSSGGGGGGNIGGGTTPVEIIGVSGGGGGGGNSSCPTNAAYGGCGGQGGSGAIFYADNYNITPGTTYPITIGTGGAGGTCNSSGGLAPQGSNGGATIFCNPLCVLCVAGGGGGGGSCAVGHDCCPGSVFDGLKGGTGGAGGNWNTVPTKSGPLDCAPCRGKPAPGMYYKTTLRYENNCCSEGLYAYGCGCSIGLGPYPTSEQLKIGSAEVLDKPWGWMGGFPASDVNRCWGCVSTPSSCCNIAPCAGGMMSNVAPLRMNVVTLATSPTSGGQYCVCSKEIAQSVGASARYYQLSWSACTLSIGNPCGIYNNGPGGDGCVAQGGGGGETGGSGVLLIRYPDQEAAATVVGGTDLSPETPGYRTYCFTSSGSITL